MIARSLTHIALVGSAVAIPYFATHTHEAGKSLLSGWNRSESVSTWGDSSGEVRSEPASEYGSNFETQSKGESWGSSRPGGGLLSPRAPVSEETPSLAARWGERDRESPGAQLLSPQPLSDAQSSQDPLALAAEGNAATLVAGSQQPSPSSLEEIFSFDINPGYIASHWPKVMTLPPQYQLQGYRTTLVTGTKDTDLAGTITYYFDTRQQLERIIFYGTTGDPRPLLAVMSNKFGLEREYTTDPGTYIYRKNVYFKPYSELRIRPARVLRASDPNTRYDIELAVRKP